MDESLCYEKGLFNNILVSSSAAIDWTIFVAQIFVKVLKPENSSCLVLYWLGSSEIHRISNMSPYDWAQAGAPLLIIASATVFFLSI